VPYIAALHVIVGELGAPVHVAPMAASGAVPELCETASL
jgi:hypothetical protein